MLIDHYQEQMYHRQEEDWERKRRNWVEQCHSVLWKVVQNPSLLETPGSEMFPMTLIPINELTRVDKHWLSVLVNSAQVEGIQCPEFSELVHTP